MSVNYKNKYLKYKNKYIELKNKNKYGGGDTYSWFIIDTTTPTQSIELNQEQELELQQQYNTGSAEQIIYEGITYSLTDDGGYSNSDSNKLLRREQKITITDPNEQAIFGMLKSYAIEKDIVLRVAGGWVRDKILGKENDDIDFTVANIAGMGMSGKVFSDMLCVHINGLGGGWVCKDKTLTTEETAKLETATLIISVPSDFEKPFELDFVGFRSEVYSENSRVPSVSPGTILQDTERRDFTINALYYNINTGKIEDYVGGVRDIHRRIIRTPIDAKTSFSNDPLRILRALRFRARFQFTLDNSIKLAMSDIEVQNKFKKISSRGRIGQEILGCFKKGSDPMLAFKEIYECSLWYIIFGGEEYGEWGTRSISLMEKLDVSMNSQNTMLATLTYPLFELDKVSPPLKKENTRVQNFYLVSIQSSHTLLTPSTKIHKCVSDILSKKDQQPWKPSDFAFIIRDVGEYFDNAIEVGKTINPELFNSVQTFAKDNNLVERCKVTPFNGIDVKNKFGIEPKKIKVLLDILFAWKVDNPGRTLDDAFASKDKFLQEVNK